VFTIKTFAFARRLAIFGLVMCPPEESSPEASQPATPKNPGGAQRRLGHRGRRRRGRGPRAPGKVGEVEPPPPDELTAQIETPGVRVPAIPARPFVPPYPNLQP